MSDLGKVKIEDFLNSDLGWECAKFGMQCGWLETSDLILIAENIAAEAITDGIDPKSEIWKVAAISRANSFEILDFLKNPAGEALEACKKRWLIYWLQDISNSFCTNNEKVLKIELVAAEFDYPEIIQHLVYFMPEQAPNNPDVNGVTGADRIVQNLNTFLKKYDTAI